MNLITKFSEFQFILEASSIIKTGEEYENINPRIKKFLNDILGVDSNDPIRDKDKVETYNDFIKFRKQVDFLRKEPKYIFPFFEMYLKDDVTVQELEQLYNRIRQHKNTLNQNGVDLTKFSEKETYEDILQEMELIEKFNKFTKLLPSQLRKVVRNDDKLKDEFKSLILEFDYDDYKDNFLTKVSKYKSVEQLFKAVENHLSKPSGMKELLKDLKSDDEVKVWYQDSTFVVALIFSRKASCKFGSQQWCISGDSGNYWDSYVGNKKGIQYFVWDFSKKSINPSSQIGITIYETFSSYKYSAHDKRDNTYEIKSSDVWYKHLKTLSELSREDREKYLYNNLPALDKNELNNSSKSFKKTAMYKIFNANKLSSYFDNIDFLSDKEVEEFVKKNPSVVTDKLFQKRVSPELLKETIIESPQIAYKVELKYLEQILSREEYKELLFNFYRSKYANEQSLRNSLPKLKYLKEELFIEEILYEDPELFFKYLSDYFSNFSFEKMKEIYDENQDIQEVIKTINDVKEDPKLFERIRSFYLTGTYKRFAEEELYVFNARYKKVDSGQVSRSGKKLYEEVLEIESMVKFDPFQSGNIISMLKLRAQIQGDLKTYHIWVAYGMFDNKETIHDFEPYGGDMILDLIDQKKMTL